MFARLALLVALLLPAGASAQSLPLQAPAPAAEPRVALDTSDGRIVIELYPERAPRTVENFLSYVKDGHYNGTAFHRVVADLLIQGGAYTPDLQKKPARAPIVSEANNGLSNLRGTVATARRMSDANSADAEFFINTVDNRQFDYGSDRNANAAGYTVFGRVVEGMDIVDRIRTVPTGAQGRFAAHVPKTPVLIERAALVETP